MRSGEYSSEQRMGMPTGMDRSAESGGNDAGQVGPLNFQIRKQNDFVEVYNDSEEAGSTQPA